MLANPSLPVISEEAEINGLSRQGKIKEGSDP